MLRSMFSAITGLRSHQTLMDVIGNNLANVNTTGFKASRVAFQDLLSQTIRGGSAPDGDRAGTNATQVGLGVGVGSIDTIHTPGSLQPTGKQTDFAIQGDGFFLLTDGQRQYFTRDGSFDIAVDGGLVSPSTGMRVLGWLADETGAVSTVGELQPLSIPMGQMMTARATQGVLFTGNLDARSQAGDAIESGMTVYDSLGVPHTIELTFTRGATSNSWTWAADSTDPAISGITAAGTTVALTATGQYDPTNAAKSIQVTYSNGAVSPATVALDMTSFTQFAEVGQVNAASQDGFAAGSLIGFNMGGAGDLIGVFSNGMSQVLGQMALASFLNPGGLMKEGRNLYVESANAGDPMIGAPATGGRGRVQTEALEGSNVDLAQQFTNMVIAQRGFQANSRIITASDEMLQDLVNLKR